MEKPGETLPSDESQRRGALRAPRLYVAFDAERPTAPASRHSLAQIEAVVIGRGDARKVERVLEGGARTLVLRMPDPFMSSTHAKLVKGFGKWSLVDARSRNGTLVAGAPIQIHELKDGDVFEAGHTFFCFEDDETHPEVPDLLASQLHPAAPGLATLIPALEKTLELVPRLATSAVSVVINAESGTGKELIARAIHHLSGRTGPFVAINCGAIPQNLVETELFGYRKGAFSGANEDRPGMIRASDGGTLFLDEIGDLPLPAQAAFLRVLQEREVLPIGATKPVSVDIRLVAATHRPLEDIVARGDFRADLLARISGYTVRLPPLRDRREDLGMLIGTLLRRVAGGAADKIALTPPAARALFRYAWPLNIRELEKCLETSYVLARGGPIQPEHLPDGVRAALAVTPAPKEDDEPPRVLTPEEQQKRGELVALLKQHDWNISAVARVMGKARTQVQRWMRRYGIGPEEP